VTWAAKWLFKQGLALKWTDTFLLGTQSPIEVHPSLNITSQYAFLFQHHNYLNVFVPMLKTVRQNFVQFLNFNYYKTQQDKVLKCS
jgi:hypothetical protein